MKEQDLADIENRLESYPPQARHDILQLVRALRRLRIGDESLAPKSDSPLHDPLTGLLNGGAYGIRFAMARARATRYNKLFAVMSIDVGHKSRSLSNDERELTLRHIAERLEGCVRETDTLARVGDESFAVILEDLVQPDHAHRVQQIVQDALSVPLVIQGRSVMPEARIGVDLYPNARQAEAERVYN